MFTCEALAKHMVNLMHLKEEKKMATKTEGKALPVESTAQGSPKVVPFERLTWNPWDPRASRPTEKVERMANSLRQVGLLQKPVGRQAKRRGWYEVAFGRTRAEAIELLIEGGEWPLPGVPVEVRQLSDRDMAIMALVENEERTDLAPIERLRAYKKALEEVSGLTITELAERLGIDRSTLSNNLRLLQLPEVVLARVDSGEMSAHAAREFLCLMNDDHAHTDIMESVISEIARTSYGTPPDWRVGNVRRLIKRRVTDSSVGEWRRLDSTKGTTFTDYGASHRADPRFDVQKFKEEFPTKVHHIPWDDKGKSLAWTCAVKEWNRLQNASPKPEVKPTAHTGRSTFTEVLAHDPVARQVKGVSQETVTGKVAERIQVPDVPPEGETTTEQFQKRGEGYKLLNTYLARWVKEHPTANWLDELLDQVESIGEELHLADYGLEEPEVVPNAILHFTEELERQVQREQTKGVGRLTAEDREKMGTRGKLLRLRELKGFRRPLASSPYFGDEGTPGWFHDLEECMGRCTQGAAYVETGTYVGTKLYCLNEECWRRKLKVGDEAVTKAVKASAERINAEDAALVKLLEPLLAAPLARVVVTALLVEDRSLAPSRMRLRPYWPEAGQEFAWVPDTLQELADSLGLKGNPNIKAWDWLERKAVLQALDKASIEALAQGAARLLVYCVRTNTEKGVQALASGWPGG